MMTSKQQATFKKLAGGHGLIVPSRAHTCELVGFNPYGDAIVARKFACSPNRQYRYLINPAGKIVARPL